MKRLSTCHPACLSLLALLATLLVLPCARVAAADVYLHAFDLAKIAAANPKVAAMAEGKGHPGRPVMRIVAYDMRGYRHTETATLLEVPFVVSNRETK